MNIAYRCSRLVALVLILLILRAYLHAAEPVPLKRIVELALQHANGGAIAAAEQQRAAAAYRELHDAYVPQITTGAGLGYSYGFPLAMEGQAPSLFTLNAQSALLNPSLREFERAAQVDSTVATLNVKDARNQIIQDAVLSYAELAKWEALLIELHQREADANKLQAAVADRVKEGVDNEMDGMRAQLSAARVRLRVTQAQDSADVLRKHLGKLTGLQAGDIQSDPDSIPAPQPVPLQDSNADALLNPSVEAAIEHARAVYLRAQGEHKSLWPSVDFAAQYALLSQFNNFQNYYVQETTCATSLGTFLCPTGGGFHQNNATIGVSIRFPLLNAAQRARAQAADADAVKAAKQAEDARNQASEQTLRLQGSAAQAQAARDVAQLEFKIAQKTVAAVQTRVDAGTANLHDLDDARAQLSERYIAWQDSVFELERAQVGLLRSTGDLEKWALGK